MHANASGAARILLSSFLAHLFSCNSIQGNETVTQPGATPQLNILRRKAFAISRSDTVTRRNASWWPNIPRRKIPAARYSVALSQTRSQWPIKQI